MAFTLKEVIPWGRTFEEYLGMFRLNQDELKQKRILGCGDGPASFNAEATQLGINVTSCDPIYAFSADEIRSQIDATYALVMEKLQFESDTFIWTTFRSPDDLGAARMTAMRRFLEDYIEGRTKGRYQVGALPVLNYGDKQFDLVLVSHFLFLYSDQFSQQFHIDAMMELCRVAHEVRVFPLNALGGTLSPYVRPVMEHLRELGYRAEKVPVSYEMQKGANTMLVISKG